MMAKRKRSPVVAELVSIDVALYAIHSARRHYPAYYESTWRELNERRNGLIYGLSPEDAAGYELLRIGRVDE